MEKFKQLKSESIINVCGWMRTQLGLKGTDLQVYAIIWSYTQFAPDQSYSRGHDFIAEWVGCTARTVRNSIAELKKKGYVIERASLFEFSVYMTVPILVTLKEDEKEKEPIFIINSIDNNIIDNNIKEKDIHSISTKKVSQEKNSYDTQEKISYGVSQISYDTEEKISYDEEDKNNKQKRFVPPTIEEVQEYCNKKGYNINAREFVMFYEQKDWMVGKNKMKNWHAALALWNEREKDKQNARPKTNQSNTSSATERMQQRHADLNATLAAGLNGDNLLG